MSAVRQPDIAAVDLVRALEQRQQGVAHMRRYAQILRRGVVHALLAEHLYRGDSVHRGIGKRKRGRFQAVPVLKNLPGQTLQHADVISEFGKILIGKLRLQRCDVHERRFQRRVHGILGDPGDRLLLSGPRLAHNAREGPGPV